jgi:hypothetical protein
MMGLIDWSKMETPPLEAQFGTRMSGAPSALMSATVIEAGFVTGIEMGVEANAPSPLPRKSRAWTLG